MSKIITILALTLISTGVMHLEPTSETKLEVILDQVTRNYKTQGFEVSISKITLVDTINNEADINGMYYSANSSIKIKSDYFENSSYIENLALIAHEVGHSVFGLEHSEDGLMHEHTGDSILAVRTMGLNNSIKYAK